MSSRRTLFRLTVLLIVLVILLIQFLPLNLKTNRNANEQLGAIALRAPLFVAVANAQSSDNTSFLYDEAGIAAYFESPTSIDLTKARGVFVAIEAETDEYIIGSVPVDGYPEEYDVHVYIAKNGGVVAYYLESDPVVKIIDWIHVEDPIIPTKLERVLSLVASAVSLGPQAYNYYDFRFPEASELILIADGLTGDEEEDSFEIKVPASLPLFERSWALYYRPYGGVGTTATYILDGEVIAQLETERYDTPLLISEGTLSATKLPPDSTRVVTLQLDDQDEALVFGGLALIYEMP